MSNIKVALVISVLTAGVTVRAATKTGLDPDRVKAQISKELDVVKMLKEAMTCENTPAVAEGSLYCFVKFRGLDLEFAAMNRKGGGGIYVKGIGRNQMLSATGRRCLTIQFYDPDLVGPMGEVDVLVRDDGMITYNVTNEKAWAACER